jgi:hypothetical protein
MEVRTCKEEIINTKRYLKKNVSGGLEHIQRK